MAIFWTVFTFAAVALLLCGGAAAAVEHIVFGKRCEGNPLLRYFTAADFENLQASPIQFPNAKKQTLRGFLYRTENNSSPKGLLLFVHGMGGGHQSYTTEINYFAQHGYWVLAYDNTGTIASDGKSLVGMPQSVRDIQAACRYIRQDKVLSALPLLLAGHSWGGYAVCRALHALPDCKGVLAFSAPDDVPTLLCAQAKAQTNKSIDFIKPFLRLYEALRFGSSAAKRTADCLQNTTAPVLLFHGDRDPVVPLSNATAAAKSVQKMENVRAVICLGKAHNVYATKTAEAYIQEMFSRLGVLAAKPNNDKAVKQFAEKLDFRKMCEEDTGVMQTALEFLDNCIR